MDNQPWRRQSGALQVSSRFNPLEGGYCAPRNGCAAPKIALSFRGWFPAPPNTLKTMKKIFFTAVAVTAMALSGLVGCKKSDVDTSRVESAFQNTPDNAKTNVDVMVAQVKTNNYSGALLTLQQSLATAKFTPEQKAALEDLGTQVKNKIAENAQKAMGEMTNAGSNAAKAAQDLFKK